MIVRKYISCQRTCIGKQYARDHWRKNISRTFSEPKKACHTKRKYHVYTSFPRKYPCRCKEGKVCIRAKWPIKFVGTHLHTWVERGTVRVLPSPVSCPRTQHNVPPGLEPGPLDPEKRAHHEATTPPLVDVRVKKTFVAVPVLRASSYKPGNWDQFCCLFICMGY